MGESFNRLSYVVSDRKVVISASFLTTPLAEAAHAWGATGRARERRFHRQDSQLMMHGVASEARVNEAAARTVTVIAECHVVAVFVLPGYTISLGSYVPAP